MLEWATSLKLPTHFILRSDNTMHNDTLTMSMFTIGYSHQLTVHQALVLVYDEVYGDGVRIRGPLTRAIVKHKAEIRNSIGSTQSVDVPAPGNYIK